MQTKLQNITINSFKKINPNSPVIIDFNDEDKNIVFLQGDEAKGKTSTLEGILWLMGGEFKLKIKEYFNNGNPINEELSFTHKDTQYKVIASGDRIVVKSLREGDKKDVWVNEASPKSFLQSVFKKCVIQNEFRFLDGVKQVEWISELFPLPKEIKNQIAEYQEKIQNMAKIERPKIGNEVKKYEVLLNNNPLYLEYQEKGEILEKEISKLEKSIEKLDIEDITSKYNKVLQQEGQLKNLKEITLPNKESELSDLERQFNEIKAKIELKKSEIEELKGSIERGELVVSKGAKIKADYDKAIIKQKESSENSIRINNFKELQTALQMYNQTSDNYQQIDSQIKQSLTQIRELKADYIPEIKNIEIVSELEMSDGQETKQIGIYINGNSLRTCSGSEYITALIKILRAAGSRYIFIDELANYGSQTIQYINDLAQEIKPQGGVIFCASMNREWELTIENKNKI